MLLPKQIWRDIPNYEGKYQVSNTGKVRNLNYWRTGETKVIKQTTDKLGYKRVNLCKDGKCTTYLVHRLVALAFIPNPNNYPIINHKDENPSNNYYKNLEWCTHEYNSNYGNCRKKMSEAKKGKKYKGKMSIRHKKLIEHREQQIRLKEQLDKIQQIYSNCHHK